MRDTLSRKWRRRPLSRFTPRGRRNVEFPQSHKEVRFCEGYGTLGRKVAISWKCLRLNMFNGIWRDLVYAGRSLAKARAFTFVCVVSLGIGMAPVIAIPYLSRILKMPPPGVKTEGLVEVLTTPLGSRGATDTWSYPDFVDLRDADTGMTHGLEPRRKRTTQTPGEAKTASSTMFVSANYFRAIGVTLARGPGFDEG